MLGRGDVLSVESVKNYHEAAEGAVRRPITYQGGACPEILKLWLWHWQYHHQYHPGTC